MIHKLERAVLFLMIIALPINCMPKRFSVFLFGQNLTDYFFLIGFALIIYEFIKDKFFVPKRLIQFLFIYTLWQCICLAIGLYTYQYDSYLTIDQIPKLEWLLMKFNETGIVLPEILCIKAWLLCKSVKSIAFLDNIVYITAFYIYHLYNKEFKKAFKDIRKAITILAILMGLYSLIELSWLKFSLKHAEEFLKIFNLYLYDIETTNNWWPPLLWDGQLRSLTREPSFFGILSTMMLPFLWSNIFEKENKFRYNVLLFYFNLMIFATNARTAIVVTLAQLLLLILWGILCNNKQCLKKIGVIITITVLAFGTNLVDLKGLVNHNNIDGSSIVFTDTGAYIDRNINSVTNTTSRSNGARWANLLANICVVRDHLVFGVGTGLKDAYMYDYILEAGKNNQEVINWSNDLLKNGVLKSGYPSLNKYADVAVNSGIIGLFMYLLPISWIIYNLMKYRNWKGTSFVCFPVISMLGLLAAQLSSAGFTECNGFIWGLLTCYIASQSIGDEATNEDKVY